MTVEVEEIRKEAELLGHHGTRCPYCKKEIYVPNYRQNPITLEELQKRAKEEVDRMKKR